MANAVTVERERRAFVPNAAWLAKQVREPIVEPDLPIVDPHHHLWDHANDRYLLAELLADTGSGHNIVATVFIDCRSMYRADGPAELRPTGETEFANGVAAMSASGLYGPTRACAKPPVREPGRIIARRSSRHRAPGGPRRRVPWPRHCASDGRRRRRETAPEWMACRLPPVPKPSPAPERQTIRSAAAKAAGISVKNGTISPSRPDSAKAARISSKPARPGLVHESHRKSGLPEQRPTLQGRLVEGARTLAAAGDQHLSTSVRGFGWMRKNSSRTGRPVISVLPREK